jgi:ketosteroid isomerase-like protein
VSNVDTARPAYQAFSSGDLAAFKEFFNHDAVWYSSDEVQPGGQLWRLSSSKA